MTTAHLLGRPTNLNHEFTASPQDKSTRRGGVKVWIFWSPKMVHYTYSVKTIFVLFFFMQPQDYYRVALKRSRNSHKTVCMAISLQWASDSFTSEAKSTSKFPTRVFAACLPLWQLLNAMRVTIAYAGRTADVFPQWWVHFSWKTMRDKDWHNIYRNFLISGTL